MKKKLSQLVCAMFIALSCPKADAQGIITTIAGTGIGGHTGDGGPATAATINNPWGVAVDGSGNIFIADEANSCIRKIDAAGVISTVVGTGGPGFSGDGGPATAAQINHPYDVIVDNAGNIYIADYNNNKIRMVNTSGVISTIAGNGTTVFSGDGAPATAAGLWGPSSLAFDPSGNLYISADGTRVRYVDPSGIIHTFAGTGVAGYSGDGGPATAAKFNNPVRVATDPSGNVYISDQLNSYVRKVNTSGIVSRVAGSGTPGYSGDGGLATVANIDNPIGIAIDNSGNVIIGEWRNYVIRQINTAGIITRIAGTTSPGYGGDGGPATMAKLNILWGICTDPTGNVYISDGSNNRIRKVTLHNKRPAFTGDASVPLNICQNSIDSLNTLLTIVDTDYHQSESWIPVITPLHGTLVATGNLPSTGGIVIPSGFSYTPTTGYLGFDTFSVRVFDGFDADTILVYVTVSAKPIVAAITGKDSVCKGATITLSDLTPGGVWTTGASAVATISGGVVTGAGAGTTTITYTVYNVGCSDTETYTIKVKICPVFTTPVVNDVIHIYPNPVGDEIHIDGLWSSTGYRLISMLGATVGTGTLATGNNIVSVQQLPAGVYMLELSDAVSGARVTSRIVKQ